MDIKEFHSLCVYHTQRAYVGHEQLPSVLFALKPNGDVLMLNRGFGSDEDKQFMFDMYATILLIEKCDLYCFVTEMWFYAAKIKPNEDVDINKLERARTHPNKKEGVILVSTNRDDDICANVFEIKTKNNQRFLLDLDEKGEHTYRDNIRLFKRIGEPSKDVNVAAMIQGFKSLTKPTWYNIIPKDNFIRVEMQA